MLISWTFYLSKNPDFFSWTAISILELFLKDHVTLKTGVMKQKILEFDNISQYYWFHFILDQINADLVNIRDFFQKRTNPRL